MDVIGIGKFKEFENSVIAILLAVGTFGKPFSFFIILFEEIIKYRELLTKVNY